MSGCRMRGRGGEEVQVTHLLFSMTLSFSIRILGIKWLILGGSSCGLNLYLGWEVNLVSGTILLLRRVENPENLAMELGCKVGSLRTSYLGLPLGAGHNSLLAWDGFEERFRTRLVLWKRQFISKGGIITHLKMFWSMPIYLMLLFQILRIVKLRLEKIQRDLLYGGGALERKAHNVIGRYVCLDKDKGRLRVWSLSTLSKALLCKCSWRIAVEKKNHFGRTL